MRFYDEILRAKSVPREVKDLLDGCVVIVADNVASYYYEGTDKERWDLADFPNVAPPFGRFWIDFKAPKYCISAETGVREWGVGMPSMWGVHCQAIEVDARTEELLQTEEGRETIKRNLIENINAIMVSLEQQRPDVYTVAMEGEEVARETLSPEHYTMLTQVLSLTQVMKEIEAGNWTSVSEKWATAEGDYKWTMEVTVFQKLAIHGKDEILGPLWTWRLFVTAEGEIAHDPITKVPLTMSAPQGELRQMLTELQQMNMEYMEAWQHLASSVNPFFHTAMLAVSFMHCRNVTLETTTPPKHIVRSNKAKRRGEQSYQPVTFKTLNIYPMKEILQRASQGAPKGEGTTRALHIARGHFRHYQGDSKLFGKYNGSFWIPQHVRGSKLTGITVKDYRIKL